MGRFFKTYLGPLLMAVLVTTVLSMVISTQRVIGALQDIGADVGMAERLSMTGYDAFRFGSMFLPFCLIAFIVAMTAASWLKRLKPSLAPVFYAGAGFVAMIVMLRLMKMAFFDVNIVAGARDMTGYILIGLAGLIGGVLFWQTILYSVKKLASRLHGSGGSPHQWARLIKARKIVGQDDMLDQDIQAMEKQFENQPDILNLIMAAMS